MNLFNNCTLSDVTLVFNKTRELYVHKSILSMNSEYFYMLFTNKFKEHDSDKIYLIVEDINDAVNLIEWMYLKNPFIPENLIYLAQMWLIPGSILEEKIQYPIPGEKYILHHNFHNGKSLKYKSISSNSRIKEIEINNLGWKQIDICYFDIVDDIKIDEYFRQFETFIVEGYGKTVSKTKGSSLILMEIIFKHNYFSKEDKKLILDCINSHF